MKEKMEKVSSILLASKESADRAEEELISKGYVKTNIWGWLNQAEINWLDKRLKADGIETPIDELNEVPGYQKTLTAGGKIIDKVCAKDYILKFEEMRSNGSFCENRYNNVEEIFGGER